MHHPFEAAAPAPGQAEPVLVAEHPDGQPPSRSRLTLRALVRNERVFLAWLAIGLVGRVIVARSSWGATDSDEAAGMLMANRAAHGQFFSLFWGGNYGGALSTWIDGPVVRVFGLHVAVFRVTNLIFLLVATVLFRVVAGKLVSRRAAIAAAVLFWVGPPGWVRWSIHEYVFWVPGICLALGAVLCALRWNEKRQDRRLWPIGFLAGAAFWLYLPLMVLVAPAVLAVAWAVRRRPVSLLKLVALVPVGALPWLYTSVGDRFETLKRSPVGPEPVTHRLLHAVTEVLPTSLVTSTGLHLSAGLATAIGVVIVGAVTAFVVRQALRRRWSLALAGTPVLAWPFVIAASGVTSSDATYRYAFLLVPVLALLLACLADQLRASLVVPILAASVTAFGGAQVTAGWARAPAYDPNLSTVAAFLVTNHRPHVYAGYWVSYVLSVASDERVTASPTGTVRDLHYQDLAAAAPHATFVFQAGLGLDQQMTAWAKAHHDGHRVAVADFAVWEFAGPVQPGSIPLAGTF